MRVLGLDIGDYRIGVAISDEMGMMAHGKNVIIRENDTLAITQLERLIDDYEIKEIIVGLPKQLSGEIGNQATKTLKFIDTMKSKINIPIKTWDERLTTKMALNLLTHTHSKKKKQKKTVDELSAVLILQNYLDYRGGNL